MPDSTLHFKERAATTLPDFYKITLEVSRPAAELSLIDEYMGAHQS